MKLKGFALMQFLGESIIIMGLSAVFLTASAVFAANSAKEDAKLKCLTANMELMDTVKSMYREGESIDSIAGYRIVNDSCTTAITGIDESEKNGLTIYKISVNTWYNDDYYKEMELVSYITAY